MEILPQRARHPPLEFEAEAQLSQWTASAARVLTRLRRGKEGKYSA
jgi:hypothetical protein